MNTNDLTLESITKAESLKRATTRFNEMLNTTTEVSYKKLTLMALELSLLSLDFSNDMLPITNEKARDLHETLTEMIDTQADILKTLIS